MAYRCRGPVFGRSGYLETVFRSSKTIMNKRLLLAFALVSILFGFTGCNGNLDDPTKKDATFFENVKEDAVQEFLSFAKVPRPGFQLDKARDYLKSWADNHGYEWHRDEYGNCWFDVPATKGMETKNKVILQGHMDMVCVAEEGTSPDFYKVVGTPVFDGGFLYGKGVNLGADDGIGVGMILAIIKADFPHGPLRCLFTADEDQGLIGAKNMAAKVLDADYLISLDSGRAGVMYAGCAGSFRFSMEKTFASSTISSEGKKIILTLTGLLGGHSGIDINKNRLSGATILHILLSQAIKTNNARIISFSSGSAVNSIANNLNLEMAVSSSHSDSLKQAIDTVLDVLRNSYPDENFSVTLTQEEIIGSDYICSEDATDNLIRLYDILVNGVVEVSVTDPDHVTKSSNIGINELHDGQFIATSMTRSDYVEWLSSEKVRYAREADTCGMTYSVIASSPAWYSKADYPLFLDLQHYYSEAAGYQVQPIYSQGGVEPAIFVNLRPTLQCTCIGAYIKDEHSYYERLDLSTIRPVVQGVINYLININ